MYQRTLISLAALGAFTALAFGSMGTGTGSGMSMSGGGQANADACQAYIDHFNGLECLPEGTAQDASMVCAGQADLPADTKPMWDCMIAETNCVDGTFDAGNQGDCAGKVTY